MKTILVIIILLTVINIYAQPANQLPLENMISEILDIGIKNFNVDIKVADIERAYYSAGENIIYLPANYTQGMLAHELTHAILQHNYPYMLSEKTQEILAKYVEYVYIHKNHSGN
jgi:hypothetical protein